MGDPIEDYPSPRDCVEALANAGADRIKLIPTGIINFKKACRVVPSEPQMTTDEIIRIGGRREVIRPADICACLGRCGYRLGDRGGVDSIEHGFFVRGDQLERICKRRTAWVPTFAPVQEQVGPRGTSWGGARRLSET